MKEKDQKTNNKYPQYYVLSEKYTFKDELRNSSIWMVNDNRVYHKNNEKPSFTIMGGWNEEYFQKCIEGETVRRIEDYEVALFLSL